MKSIGMLVLILALLPAPAGHAQDDAAGLDPVIADVVRMLGEGVSAEFILDWLDSSDRRPGQLSPDDLIALSHAEAPPELVRARTSSSTSWLSVNTYSASGFSRELTISTASSMSRIFSTGRIGPKNERNGWRY